MSCPCCSSDNPRLRHTVFSTKLKDDPVTCNHPWHDEPARATELHNMQVGTLGSEMAANNAKADMYSALGRFFNALTLRVGNFDPKSLLK